MSITVTALSTTPIKGTRIHSVDAVAIGPQGARGDRAFYVIDATATMVNGKRVGALQQVVADYAVDRDVLSLTLPDGSGVGADVRLGDEVATTFHGTPRSARLLEGPWSAALSQLVGEPLRVVCGGPAVDRGARGAVSLVSRGSLRRLAQAGPEAGGDPVDPRRLRMLIEVDGVAAHAEDDWVDRELRIGTVHLRIRGHVGRCVVTTRSPDTGEVDHPVLKLLADYRREVATTEPLALGVHGEVLGPGTVRVGDAVSLEPAPA